MWHSATSKPVWHNRPQAGGRPGGFLDKGRGWGGCGNLTGLQSAGVWRCPMPAAFTLLGKDFPLSHRALRLPDLQVHGVVKEVRRSVCEGAIYAGRVIAAEGGFALLFVLALQVDRIKGGPERLGEIRAVPAVRIRMVQIETVTDPTSLFLIHDE